MTSPAGQGGLKARYAAAVMNTFGPPKLALARGQGALVWDEDGREYLDLLAGIAVNSLGHAHPALVGAVTSQLNTLGHVSNFFTTEPQVALAERLLSLLGAEGRVFFANSGAEANEAALKSTRRTGRSHLVAMEGSFHGRTMGALALTSKAAYRQPFEPLPGEVDFVPFGDSEALARAVSDRTAAVVLEPIQGEAGVRIPPPSFLRAAREIASDAGALLWVDEVQTGIGRTGEWFAHSSSGITPDLVTVAKGLAGGIPIGACIATGTSADLLQPGNHGTTFGGNPVATAAALAVIDTIESDGLLNHVQHVGRRLAGGLPCEGVDAVRQSGLLIGIDLAASVASGLADLALERGFILNACGPDTIRLAPPLVLTESQADSFLEAWPGLVASALAGAVAEAGGATGGSLR